MDSTFKRIAPFVRSGGNYDRNAMTLFLATINSLPTKTIQSDQESADINHIVNRYLVTGELLGRQMPPAIEEFQDVFDFQSAMNTIRRAQESFSTLTADQRERFSNDPGRFVTFCSDPANLPELRKLGLAPPEVPPPSPPAPVKVEVVNPVVPPK